MVKIDFKTDQSIHLQQCVVSILSQIKSKCFNIENICSILTKKNRKIEVYITIYQSNHYRWLQSRFKKLKNKEINNIRVGFQSFYYLWQLNKRSRYIILIIRIWQNSEAPSL